jgi:hypothetical protein
MQMVYTVAVMKVLYQLDYDRATAVSSSVGVHSESGAFLSRDGGFASTAHFRAPPESTTR